MKKVLLSILFVAITVWGMAQNKNRTTPDDADAYIKGYLSIKRNANGEVVYKLDTIRSQKITFKDPYKTRTAKKDESKELITFTFDEAKVEKPYDLNNDLDFWRWDYDINQWQHDMEVRQGQAGMQSSKSVILMLVLDCSSSIETAFKQEIDAAKGFLKTFLDKSNGSGLIKVGIVSFSTMKDTKSIPIKELTYSTFPEFEKWLDGLHTARGTALYYAMDMAVEGMINNYIEYNLKEDLLSVVMVTFTDGLDQTSRDPDRDILTAEKYKEVVAKFKDKKFTIDKRKYRSLEPDEYPTYTKTLEMHECGLRGGDIETEDQWEKLQKIGRELTGDNFYPILKIKELNKYFEDLSDRLIKTWTVLNLHVPNSYEGRVAWTYPNKKKVKVEKVKEEKPKPVLAKNYFLGINIGAGLGVHDYKIYDYSDGYLRHEGGDYDFGVPVTIGFDLAFPITDKTNMGFYLSAGHEFVNGGTPIDFGPLFLFNLNKGSIYAGLGMHIEPYIYGRGDMNIGGNFRFGYKFKSGLYLFYQFAGAADDQDYDYYYNDYYYGEVHRFNDYKLYHSHTFHIGFNFLNKKSNK